MITAFLYRAMEEIMWKNIVEPAKLQMAIWRFRITCWILKATNTHTECVIRIAFPLQQWWGERASMIRCTYIACLDYLRLVLAPTTCTAL